MNTQFTLYRTKTGGKLHNGYEGSSRTHCGCNVTQSYDVEIDFFLTSNDLCPKCFGDPKWTYALYTAMVQNGVGVDGRCDDQTYELAQKIYKEVE